MKKKSIFVILAVASMALLLAACGGNNEPPAPARGHWSGNTFASPYFGLRFDITAEWVVTFNDEFATRYLPEGQGLPAAGDEITPELHRLAEERGVFDLMVSLGEPQRLEDIRGSVTTSIRRLPDDMAGMTETEVLSGLMEEAEDAVIVHTNNEDTISIGIMDWYFMDIIVNDILNQRIFVNIDEDNQFLRQITISYVQNEDLESILDMFRAH